MKLLLQEIQDIKTELSESREKLKKLKHKNGVLKQAMNFLSQKWTNSSNMADAFDAVYHKSSTLETRKVLRI